MRRVLWLLALCACSGTLDTADQVHDLRLLAMRTDPPQQLVTLSDAGATPPLSSIETTVLLADPQGQGRNVHGVFATCARVDDGTQQCLPTSSDYSVLGEVDVVPAGGPSAEMKVSFTPSDQLLADALAQDPFHGFGYLPIPVQVTISAGSESQTGVKFAYLSAPIGSQPATVNPVIPLVTLNGTTWEAGSSPPLVVPSGGALVDPVTPPGLEVTYQVPTFRGGEQTFTEAWSYHFFVTAGKFNHPSSGGVIFGQPQVTTVSWQPNAGDQQQLVYLWIVVDDGRGGIAWTERTAQFSP